MINFLYNYEKRRYGYGILQELLRELSPLPEGGTSNPAVWKEWKKCVNESLKAATKMGDYDDSVYKKYTEFEGFNAMVDFFINYYKRTSDGDLRTLMEVILNLEEDSSDQASWSDWNTAAKKALQNKNNEKFAGKFVEKKLTELQAYNAMIEFLEWYYKKTTSDFMGSKLGVFSFLPDGEIVDVAFWEDWGIAIKEVLDKENNKEKVLNENILGISITELQAFRAMVQLFKNYFRIDPNDPDAIMLFDYLDLLPDGSSENSVIKEKWKQCVDEALQESPGIREYRIICLGNYIKPKNLN